MSNSESGSSAAAPTIQVLAAASHTTLLQSGNPHYFELYNECMRVKYELEAEKYLFLSLSIPVFYMH
jgi:hypothetical protein